jgi:hypothetical protein
MGTEPPPAYWLPLLRIQDDEGMRDHQSCGETCRLRMYPDSTRQSGFIAAFDQHFQGNCEAGLASKSNELMPLHCLESSAGMRGSTQPGPVGPHVTVGRYNRLIGQRQLGLDAAQIRGSLGSRSSLRRMPGNAAVVRFFSRSK